MVRLTHVLVALGMMGAPAMAEEGKGHIVFVLGEKEYGTLENVPKFFDAKLKPAGYTATFIVAQPEDDVRNDFSGLAEALQDADLAFVSVRRRAPEKEDMQALKDFVAAGKPLVAIRTSSHAFHLKDKPIPEGHDVWEAFDPAVLGGNYHGHYREEMATVTVVEGTGAHPILKGISSLPKSDKLYQTGPLAESANLLLEGTIEGQRAEPLAWTNTTGPNRAKVFYTSMGQRSDFESAEFHQLLKQAVEWALE